MFGPPVGQRPRAAHIDVVQSRAVAHTLFIIYSTGGTVSNVSSPARTAPNAERISLNHYALVRGVLSQPSI